MSVSEALRTIREKKKMTRKQLAIKSGLSIAAIYYIEHGERSATQSTLNMLAQALGVKVTDLMDDADKQKEPAPDRSRQEVTDSVMGLFASLPPELQAQALGYLRGLAAASRKR